MIGHSAASAFDLIEAAGHYPEFLPWCANAVILERDATVVMARITIHLSWTPLRPDHTKSEATPALLTSGPQRVEQVAQDCSPSPWRIGGDSVRSPTNLPPWVVPQRRRRWPCQLPRAVMCDNAQTTAATLDIFAEPEEKIS